jgi:hypothetical protein
MRLPLTLHPDCVCEAVTGIDVEAVRTGARGLDLRYRVLGDIAGIALPQAGPHARTDELWRHTCFEAFVRSAGGGYYEFNFAPSTQWAVYRFSGYREGMKPALNAFAPDIEGHATPGVYELRVSLDLGGLSDLPRDAPWKVALTAVIEDAAGAKSYWSLAHAPGKPDFHHADSFAHKLITTDIP